MIKESVISHYLGFLTLHRRFPLLSNGGDDNLANT